MGVKQLCLTLEAEGDRNLGECSKLAEPAATVFRAWFMELAWRGFGRLRVVEGVRGLDREQELWGYGRSELRCAQAGVPVKYARPGHRKVVFCLPEESMHVKCLAMDVDTGMYSSVDQARIRDVARKMGITCGADWTVRDMNHYQVGE